MHRRTWVWPVDGVGGVHRALAEGGGGVFDQGDVVPELYAEAAGRLDTGFRTSLPLRRAVAVVARQVCARWSAAGSPRAD